MSILKFILDGLLSITNSNVEVGNYRSPNNGFKHDRENLSGDVKQVGTDMRMAILDDVDDLSLAEQRLIQYRAGKTKSVPIEEVMKRYGLES